MTTLELPRTITRTSHRRVPWVSTIVLVVIVLGCLIGPVIRPYDNTVTHLTDRLLPPGSHTSYGIIAWFGTDAVGRDLLGQVLEGGRVSLLIGLVTVIIAFALGTIVGMISGYLGGKTDLVIMRIVDIQMALPSIVLAIVVTGILGPSPTNLVIAMVAARWTAFARLARGSTLSLKEREYVSASRLLGKNWVHIIGVHILPFLRDQLVVLITLEFGQVILQQAALSFLGIGLPTDISSWGSTIAAGQNYLDSAWWISTIPGVVLAALVVAVGFVSESGSGPRTRKRIRMLGRTPTSEIMEGMDK
ncbi:ABC transporter permease [Rathayibacter sp. CAU 1779]